MPECKAYTIDKILGFCEKGFSGRIVLRRYREVPGIKKRSNDIGKAAFHPVENDDGIK